jgi:acyl-CoA dehydrogenase
VESLSAFGFFGTQPCLYALLTLLLITLVGYLGSPLIVWAIAILGLLVAWGAPPTLIYVVAAILLIFLIKPIRQNLITRPLMKAMAPIMPKISETERTALDAGVVWVEKDLFSGKPDFKKLLHEEPYPSLTAEEQAFMDNQVEKLCSMVDAWKVWKTREMDQAIWDYIKKEKFLGMIIPKEYGGLGFSALAHSQVIMKLSSRSVSACISVMVPNSLGPAELLIHYGTDAQKNKYLPKLAIGEEMPCFALTEPGAGSDAGSLTSSGELFKGDDGRLYLKLNWNKRWITLAAISTVLGLAFRLRDPKNLLGKGEDVGITCALIPSKTPGVVLGQRHDPLGTPFYNCPTQGHDVIVPADEVIIGGLAGAGRGWAMLMDCLAAGRGISLPAQSTGGAKLATLVTSAHSVIRQQFGVSIGNFEGVQEPLARIAGSCYQLEAMRKYTLGALDKGIKPPVVTAMMKYHSTEMGRRLINDAMDIMGGAGISMGPRNTIAEIYIATPIGITVEGANIMTRTLIIFGQGALRAHPYAYKEVKAIEQKDLSGFDSAFWGHIGHIVRNTFRSIVLSITRGYVAPAPVHCELRQYVRRLTWASASFSILADLAMGTLGGDLKFREKITGRFADLLAHMYMATATIRRFEAEGRREEDLAFVKYSLKWNLAEIQKAFDGIFDNMYGVQKKGLARLMFGALHFIFKHILGAWSRINSIGSQATDHLQQVICQKIMTDAALRDRLVEGVYRPKEVTQQIGRLENAMKLVLAADAIEKKVYKARKKGELPRLKGAPLMEAAREKGIVSADEFATLKKAAEARWDAIQVDDFSQEQYLGHHWP